MTEKGRSGSSRVHVLYVVSGGYGASGEQLARTALAQFSDVTVPVNIVPHVETGEQIRDVVKEVAREGGTILHTLVNGALRAALVREARKENVPTIDLIGTLLSRLTNVLEQEPVGQPGLYHQLREDYFNRVEAIEYTVGHDDGMRRGELDSAELVIVGPSRVGKTPLSMFLSVQGWKVANIPLIKDVEPPSELFQIDRHRVVGLTIDAAQLVAHRKRRQNRLGIKTRSDYTDPLSIVKDIEAARLVCRKGGFPILNVTDRPIEDTAEEVIALVKRRTNQGG